MADKKLNFATGNNKYDDHLLPTAADAFASVYSLNAANFAPFSLPYYNPGVFFNQNCQPTLPNMNGYSFWHTFGAPPSDYVFNLAALQNIRALAAVTASNQCGESFYDVLNKISNQTTCAGNDKDSVPPKCSPAVVTPHIVYSPSQTPIYQSADAAAVAAAALNRPSSSRTYVSTPFANQLSSSSSSPSSSAAASSPHSNLATLAEVASCLTPEIFTKSPRSSSSVVGGKNSNKAAFSSPPPASSSPKHTTIAERGDNDNKTMSKRKNDRKRYRALSNSTVRENMDEKVQKLDASQVTSSCRNRTTENNSHHSVKSFDNLLNGAAEKETNNNNLPATNCNFTLDQNLLNASAMALAALTGQWMAAAAAAEKQESTYNKTTTSPNSGDNRTKEKMTDFVVNNKTVSNEKLTKPKRPYRRKTGVDSNNGRCSLNGSTAVDCSFDLVDETIDEVVRIVCSRNEHCHKRTKKCEQANVAAAANNNHFLQTINNVCADEVLDLSVKKDNRIKREENSQYVVSEQIESRESKFCCKKRRVAETNFIRTPLTKGWRRQTCIRTVSASGIRGDVIYYAPCGKRLATSGEVLRYLKKYPEPDVSREHFSFSSRVLVGEYLEVKPSGNKTLTEDEMRNRIQSLQRTKNPSHNNAVSTAEEFIEIKASTSTNNCSKVKEASSKSFPVEEDEIEKVVRFCVSDLVNVVASTSESAHRSTTANATREDSQLLRSQKDVGLAECVKTPDSSSSPSSNVVKWLKLSEI